MQQHDTHQGRAHIFSARVEGVDAVPTSPDIIVREDERLLRVRHRGPGTGSGSANDVRAYYFHRGDKKRFSDESEETIRYGFIRIAICMAFQSSREIRKRCFLAESANRERKATLGYSFDVFSSPAQMQPRLGVALASILVAVLAALARRT